MKRLIFVVALVLSFASIGAAQQKTMTQAQLIELSKELAAQQNITILDEPVAAPTAQRPVDVRRSSVEALFQKYSNAYNADGTIGDFRQNLQLREQIYYDTRVAEPYINNRYEVDPAAGFFGSYYDGVATQARALRVQGAAKTGFLKINGNGDTNFARYLHVLRKEGNNWVYVGGGGKSFRIFHKPMELPVGHHTLRFELRRDGKTTFLVEEFDIQSKYDRNQPLQYTVDSEAFASFANVEEIKRQ